FYASGMDSLGIQKLGYSVIQADLNRVSKLKTQDDVLNELAIQRINGIGNPLYSFYVGQDRKQVTRMIPQLAQGGTTLPDRDYYLKDDTRSKTIREAYLKYI